MFPIGMIVFVLVVFGMLFFLDLIFKTCMFYPYIKFLHDTGLSIKPFIICWESTYFNRKIKDLGRFKPLLLRSWFQLGAIIVSACMIPALLVLFVPLYDYLYPKERGPIVVPVIPGYNLQYSYLPYYIISLFISIAFHEFGHALAASREKISIEGCGVALYGFIPVAYVRLPVEQLKQFSPAQQLRIFAAGIWHNLVLCGFVFLLSCANPVIFKSLCLYGEGVSVTGVLQGSGLSQKGGLTEGDKIYSVNECLVETSSDWIGCLRSQESQPQSGYCASKKFIKLEASVLARNESRNCNYNSSRYICVRYADPTREQLMSLPGRRLVENGETCNNDQDCPGEVCCIPVLKDSERFIVIRRTSNDAVIYLGSVHELLSSVSVTPWVCRYFAVQYMKMYETLLGFIFAFSGGLALMNIIPCFWLDGQYLTECVIYSLRRYIPKPSHHYLIIFILKVIGAILITLCAITAFLRVPM